MKLYKTTFHLLFLAFMLFLAACASREKLEKPYFWEIRKGGKSSYMFGTMHDFVDPDELPEFVLKYLDDSEVFVMEVKRPGRTSANLVLAPPPTEDRHILKKQLSPVAWERLRYLYSLSQYIEGKYKLKRKKLEEMNATQAIYMIDMLIKNFPNEVYDYLIKDLPFEYKQSRYWISTQSRRASSLDIYFRRRAFAKNKFIFGLDDPAQIREVVLRGDMKSLENYLNRDVKKAMRKIKELEEIKRLYRSGDEVAMNTFDDKIEDRDPEYIDLLLRQRNETWLPKIVDYHERMSPVFFAVGASHLVREHNVLDSLKKQGFLIYRLDKDGPVIDITK